MTPMIDIVFQLVVFFLLVLDLTQPRFEPLELPEADQATLEKIPPPYELIVNLREDGRIMIDGRVLHRAGSDDFASVRRLFRNRRSVARLAEAPVLVRADRSAAWRDVQRLMAIASAEGAVTRLRFGARIGAKP